MADKSEFKENSQAVQAHLNITQNVIQRMASNCTSCKGWAIALVSAMLVIIADKGKSNDFFIATIPTVLFWALDAYYLGLEKMFRNSYNNFIGKLHAGKLVADDLFAVSPTGNMIKVFLCSLFSFSVWPLYLTLLSMVFVVKQFLL